MDLNLLLLIATLSTPAIGVYICLQLVSNHVGKKLVFYTSIIISATYLIMLSLGWFVYVDSSVIEKIICLTIIFVCIFIASFPAIHHRFNVVNNAKDPKCKVGSDCSEYVSYYKDPKKAIAVAYMFRTVLFTIYSLWFSMFLIMLLIQDRNLLIKLTWILFGLVFVFLICNAFVRLLVKCENCGSHVFYIERELNAYFVVAKRAVKNKILDCEYCYATYALDSSLDLNQLRKEKKERIQKDNQKMMNKKEQADLTLMKNNKNSYSKKSIEIHESSALLIIFIAGILFLKWLWLINVSAPLSSIEGLHQRLEVFEKNNAYVKESNAHVTKGAALKFIFDWPGKPTERELDALGELVELSDNVAGELFGHNHMCTISPFSYNKYNIIYVVNEYVIKHKDLLVILVML